MRANEVTRIRVGQARMNLYETTAPTGYAAFIAALSQNSWKCVIFPFLRVNTIAKSESKAIVAGVVAV
jgi:hypothetical protein